MKSFDFEAVAYDGECYCTGCLPEGVTVDDEEVSPIFADSEWDSYPSCHECHCVHDYVGLTEHGLRQMSLRQAIGEHNEGSYDGFASTKEQEYPPDDYDGEWLHINDHGNCTLYVRRNGEDKGIASCV